MSSPRSRSVTGTPAAPSVDDEASDPKPPVTNRNSWIYNTIPLRTQVTPSRNMDTSSGVHQRVSSKVNTPNSATDIDRQINAAVDILGSIDFVEGVMLLCEKHQLRGEEVMRRLYNTFYTRDSDSPERRQTWSQHRQQHPPATITTPKPPEFPQPLQLRDRFSEKAWHQPIASNRTFSSSTYPPKDAANQPANILGHHIPASPSMPTFPSNQMEAVTRQMRGATFSNAYKRDGTALDQRFASQLNLYGSGPVGDGHHFLENEPVERASYNPAASTFTPTGPRHMMTQSLHNPVTGYGTVPDMITRLQGGYPNINTATGQASEWFRKVPQYNHESPSAINSNDHDDSGVGLTPPKNGQDQSMGRVVAPADNQGGTNQKRFIPMNAAINASNFQTPTQPHYFKPALQPLPNTKFSDRYLGQHTDSNASANIPEDYNCAIWIRNLPPDVTYTELLGTIKGVGRIWCSYVNMPDYEKHHTAAAKVVFYRPESARAYLQFVWTQNPEIRGLPVKADLNRIKSAPHSLSEGTSRVLIITGEDWFADEKYLIEWFGQQCQFQLDQTVAHIRLHGRAVIEFRFGSYRSQAEAGFKALTINRPKGFDKVDFGDDPCEVGENWRLISKSIASAHPGRGSLGQYCHEGGLGGF